MSFLFLWQFNIILQGKAMFMKDFLAVCFEAPIPPPAK